jgi:hypothetical protein
VGLRRLIKACGPQTTLTLDLTVEALLVGQAQSGALFSDAALDRARWRLVLYGCAGAGA